jgi:hypothetical protein
MNQKAMEARSIQAPMLTPTAIPICEGWERPSDDAWLVEAAVEVAIVEDGLLDKAEVLSDFVDVLDNVDRVDCEELGDAIE